MGLLCCDRIRVAVHVTGLAISASSLRFVAGCRGGSAGQAVVWTAVGAGGRVM